MARRGFRLRLWDFSPFLHPVRPPVPGGFEPKGGEEHRAFASRAEACAAIRDLPKGSLAVCLFAYDLLSFPVFRAMSRAGLRAALFMANLLPSLPRSTALLDPRTITPGRVMRKAFSLIPPRLLGVRAADFILAGGERSVRRWPVVGPKTRIVWAHMLDYDIHLASGAPDAEERLGVFLDEYLPFHPDYVLTGTRAPMSAEDYYPPLCRAFSAAEKALGIEVVVAAHPRSDYARHGDLFEGRRVVSGDTVGLIRRSRVVFAHASTSLSFAVLSGKPIVFLSEARLERDAVGGHVEAISSLLGKAPVDMSRPETADWERELAVDAAAYARYRNDFIKKEGSEERPFWEIVVSAAF